jgi:hypothetical protein
MIVGGVWNGAGEVVLVEEVATVAATLKEPVVGVEDEVVRQRCTL